MEYATIKNRPKECPTGWCDCLSCKYRDGEDCKHKPTTEHTKGEWRLEKAVVGHPHYNVMADGVLGVIAHIPPHADEFEANARLIAAAPDMCEALKALVNASSEDETTYAMWLVEKALAKAEGK